MEAAVEPPRREHPPHVAVFAQEGGAQALIVAEEGGGDQGDGCDFGVAHLGLRIVFIASGAEEVVAKAVECDNMFLHGGPRE